MTISVTIKKKHPNPKKAFVRTVDFPKDDSQPPVLGEPVELVDGGGELEFTLWDSRTLQVFEEQ